MRNTQFCLVHHSQIVQSIGAFHIILGDALALGVHRTKVGLRQRISLLSGLAIQERVVDEPKPDSWL